VSAQKRRTIASARCPNSASCSLEENPTRAVRQTRRRMRSAISGERRSGGTRA
jgi:hypothetical protein